MLNVTACSETGVFTGWSVEVFHSLYFRKYISYAHYLFVSKCLKFDVGSRNGIKNSENVFCLSDNSICVGSGKFSQSWTGYLPSIVTVLTNTAKILPNTRWGTSQINFLQNDENHDKSALMDILQVFRTLSHVDCQVLFRNEAFYRKVWRSFSQSVISEIL